MMVEKFGKFFCWSKFIVVFGVFFYDIGNMIYRMFYYQFSVFFVELIIDKFVREFEERDFLFFKVLIFNVIYIYDEYVLCIIIEGFLVMIVDGCDMEEGRSRFVYKKDKVDIYVVLVFVIKRVEIKEGNEEELILIEIWMKYFVGIFQVDEILIKKVKSLFFSGKVRFRIYIGVDGEIFEKVV